MQPGIIFYFSFFSLSSFHTTIQPLFLLLLPRPSSSLSCLLPTLSLFSLPFLYLRLTLILSLFLLLHSLLYLLSLSLLHLRFTLSPYLFFLLLPGPFSSLLSSSCHVFIFLSLLHLRSTLVFYLPSTLALLHLSLSLPLCPYSPPPCECWRCCFEGVCRRSTKAIKLTAWRGERCDQLSVFTSAGDVTWGL